MKTVVETANAKINLALDVIGKRDDGYHELEMVMTSVALSDRLTFKPLKSDEILITCDEPSVPTDESNLVYQAIRLMKDQFHIQEGLSVQIKKHIPVAAGLAGGSSNAAAAIRAMDQLFDLQLSLDQMYRIGERIGSDVPFCIYNKTAFVTGRGEHIEPLPPVPESWVVLVNPNIPVSTREVFNRVDVRHIEHPNVARVRKAIINQNYVDLVKHLGNALESVTFSLYPEVKRLKETIESFEPDGVLMSGSGPTIFALTRDYELARTIQANFQSTSYKISIVNLKI